MNRSRFWRIRCSRGIRRPSGARNSARGKVRVSRLAVFSRRMSPRDRPARWHSRTRRARVSSPSSYRRCPDGVRRGSGSLRRRPPRRLRPGQVGAAYGSRCATDQSTPSTWRARRSQRLSAATICSATARSYSLTSPATHQAASAFSPTPPLAGYCRPATPHGTPWESSVSGKNQVIPARSPTRTAICAFTDTNPRQLMLRRGDGAQVGLPGRDRVVDYSCQHRRSGQVLPMCWTKY
jgi:hypothetical protein